MLLSVASSPCSSSTAFIFEFCFSNHFTNLQKALDPILVISLSLLLRFSLNSKSFSTNISLVLCNSSILSCNSLASLVLYLRFKAIFRAFIMESFFTILSWFLFLLLRLFRLFGTLGLGFTLPLPVLFQKITDPAWIILLCRALHFSSTVKPSQLISLRSSSTLFLYSP